MPNSLLNYGISYEQQESRRPWREDRTVTKTGAHQITNKNRMADMDTDKLAAYLRGEFGFTLGGRQLTLTPGLRAEQRKLTPQEPGRLCDRRAGRRQAKSRKKPIPSSRRA
jgi:hemoglobin/transferrin/lactoferrin receptor protein